MPVILSLVYGLAAWLLFDGLTVSGLPRVGREGRLERRLAEAGLQDISPRQFVLASAASGLGTGLFAQAWPGWWVLSLCAAAVGTLAPYTVLARRARRRREQLEQALIESIEQLRDLMRTKTSLHEGLAVLAESGPEKLRPEVARVTRRIALEGFATAVEEMRVRLAHPLSDMLCKTLVFGERLGSAQVIGVLEQLAGSARARMRVQAEVRASQSKNVLSAQIIALLPLLLLLAIKRVNPSYLAFYDTPGGQLVLLVCLGLLAAGYYFMLRLSRLPEERRLLR